MLLFKNNIKPYLFIILATGLLYLWQCYQYPMINPDGVIYLESAAAYLTGGVKAVLAFDAQAKWPFYSICIAYMHIITGASIPVAERLLDGSFIILTACIFLYLTRLFSPHKSAYFWGSIIWLTWHAYVKWWPEVVRDHGFMASLLLSVFCYYRFILTQRFSWALAWSLSIFLAEAFRIEAVLYLIFVPFSILLLKNSRFSRRCCLWLKLNFLSIIFMLILGILFFEQVLSLHSLRFAYIGEEFSGFYVMVADRFMQSLQLMHAQIFYRENDFVAYALIASYVVVFFGYMIAQVSLAALPPLFFIRRAWRHLNPLIVHPAFFVYFAVATITPLLFFVEHAFLNGRYLLPLGFLSLLFVASSLPCIIDALIGKKKIYFIVLLGLLLLINATANVFRFGHQAEEDYIVGNWLKKHYPEQTVFTNVRGIFFYTHKTLGDRDVVYQVASPEMGAEWLRQHDAWCQYDVLVMMTSADKAHELRQIFVQFQRKNALGPISKSFIRTSNHQEIFVASINAAGCKKLVDSHASLT
jgi:hypothetical protein